MRLNQAIAKSGYCSRRNADNLIAQGRVKINGKTITDFSVSIDPNIDKLSVNGQLLKIRQFTYLAMYKPKGIVTTCQDEQGRKTVLDLLPADLRHLKPVGRLDLASEGLLILTNDGDLTQKLTHPSMHTYKHYLVSVKGVIKEKDLAQMAKGVMLEDGLTSPAKVKSLGIRNDKSGLVSTFTIAIQEGRNRQIRRMCVSLGYSVTRLVRTGIGALQLGKMTPGTWRHLTVKEINALNT